MGEVGFLLGLVLGFGQLLLNGRDLTVQNAARLRQVAFTRGLVGLDALLVELRTQVADLVVAFLLGVPTGVESCELLAGVGQFALELGEALLGGRVLGLLQLHLLHFEARHLALQLVDLLGLRVEFHAQVRSGLVHQVDGLVGQLTTGDVAVREGCGGHERVVADRHLVVGLIALLQATQNGDRVLHTRLAHEHLLETTLQGRILLDVLTVFVERGGADQAQFATGQHRLEHIARVHRAFGRTGTDDRMDLVDEGDDLAVGLLDLVKHALEAFLEFAAVLAPGHHGAQVEADEALVLQCARHVAGHDALGEAFHDGGLAHAWLADQHRVVLRAAAQNLDHTADLLIPADHRVELAFTGTGRQVGGELLQRLVRGLGVRARHLGATAHVRDGRAHLVGRDAVLLENLGRLVRGGVENAQQQVLGGDVLISHVLHFLAGVGQRGGQLAAGRSLRGRRAGSARQRDQGIAHLRADRLPVRPHGLDETTDDTVLLTQQRVKQMQRLNLRVAGGRGALHRVAQGLLSQSRIFLFHIILHISPGPRMRDQAKSSSDMFNNGPARLFPKLE